MAPYGNRVSYPAVGNVGKGKVFIGISAPQEWADFIDERAKSLRMTRAGFTLAIVERWFEQGGPPVTDADRALQLLQGKPAKQTKQSA